MRWDVPFAEARDPSVSIITEHGGDVVTLIVAPTGIDQYPKYRVRFDKVISLLYYEEAFSFHRGYRTPSGSGMATTRCPASFAGALTPAAMN